MKASGVRAQEAAALGGVRVESCGEAGSTRTWQLPLQFSRPPLTANQRHHWTYRSRITREIHAQVIWQARKAKVPTLTCPTVTLHYTPTDRRRRDVDNLVPTSKACVDALRAVGVIVDDDPAHVDHRMPVIHPPAKPGALWLEVTERAE